jgi:hypothetical protein
MTTTNLCRSLFVVVVVSIGPLACTAAAQPVDVLTHRYDNARSGANLKETTLSKSNVKKGKFGKLAFRNVDGNIYAQPLIVSQAAVAARPGQSVNLVLVATEHNSVYAFDADDTSPDTPTGETTKALWRRGPDAAADGTVGLGPSIEGTTLYPKIGAPNCQDLTTEVGITSTPAIKLTQVAPPKRGIVFVVAKTTSGNEFVYKLYALDLSDGKPLSDGTLIQGGVQGPNGTIQFAAARHLNRPALLLENDVLYVAFGGHCDAGDYRGWVFAYDVSKPSAPQRLDVLSTTVTPRKGGFQDKEGRAGIWMSGFGPAAVDGDIYFATGDGTYKVDDPKALDLGNSVVKIGLANGKIEVRDWFSPQNRDDVLKKFDADLGSGGAVPVPNSHLLLAGGKEGRLYLIDRNAMGRGTALSLQSFMATNNPMPMVPNPQAPGDIMFWNLHGAPVIWPRGKEMFVYLMAEEDPLKQFKLVPDGGPGGWKFQPAAPIKVSKQTAGRPPQPRPNKMVYMPGGFATLSANGTNPNSGIVWVTMPFKDNANQAVVEGVLRAFDAMDVSKGQLWSSADSGPNEGLGFFAKYNPPVVANGKVYVAAFQQERIDNGIHFPATGGLKAALVIFGPKP